MRDPLVAFALKVLLSAEGVRLHFARKAIVYHVALNLAERFPRGVLLDEVLVDLR